MTHETGVGTLSKIQYTGTVAPRIARHPASKRVLVGEAVSFEVAVDGALSIQWQRDGSDIAGETGERYTIDRVTAADDGAVFRVVATNPLGTTTSDEARLTVSTRKPPTAAIRATASSEEYEPGGTLMFAGSSDDDAVGYFWQVDFHHDTHTHPLLGAMKGERSLSFKVPKLEAEQANTWLRVWLRVENSDKLSSNSSFDVFPARQLSSQPPLAGSSPVERDRALAIGGIPYLRGLAVRAPSELSFALADGCSGKLLTDVGVDDEVGDGGSVVFKVYLGDEQIFDSGVLRGSDARVNVALELTGGRRLRLVVEDGGDGTEHDHADWAGARVTGCQLVAGERHEPAADGGVVTTVADAATSMAVARADAGAARSQPQRDKGGCSVRPPGAARSHGLLGWMILVFALGRFSSAGQRRS